MCAVSFKAKVAQSIYDFLDIGKSPRPADCIFALAGKPEQKVYGIKMWRFGYAAQLILSVGGLEWRRFDELNLDSDGGLASIAANAPAGKGHFFVRLDPQEPFCTPVREGFLRTRSEARALMQYLRDLSVRSLLVVSSPAHLRRAALIYRRVFRKSGIQLTFIAVPEKPSFDDSSIQAEIWSEFGKYLLCRLLLIG
jgi:hypothetical protein